MRAGKVPRMVVPESQRRGKGRWKAQGELTVCTVFLYYYFWQSEDVIATKALLKMCSPLYHNLKLTPDCQESCDLYRQRVPKQCSQHNAVYNILYYLVDTNFLPPNVSILKLVRCLSYH
jgi:hypothetical protein